MVRKKYSSDFKAKVALDALKSNKTISELSSVHSVHPNQISQWKKQLQEGVKDIFANHGKNRNHEMERTQDLLYQEIGRLKVELDWLKKKV
jgi:putative transposase